jgi:hypothetical protein
VVNVIQKFRDTARALECDEDEGKFEAALKKVAKAKPKADKGLKPDELNASNDK